MKNIHLYSWLEHCKTYLSRITSCKQRQPQWQRSEDEYESPQDSPNDSLRDIKDISLNLKLSMDGEKNEGGSGGLDTLDAEDTEAGRKNLIENAVLTLSKGVLCGSPRPTSAEKEDQNSGSNKFPAFRRRKHVFVIAADSDSDSELLEIINRVFEAAGKERESGSIGVMLSTGLTISEVHSILISGSLSPTDFDGFICNSGSELYYPSSSSEEDSPSGLPYVVDLDYRSHTEYRWGGEGLRKTLLRWAASVNEKSGGETVSEDGSSSTAHCYAFKVNQPSLVCITQKFPGSVFQIRCFCLMVVCLVPDSSE